VWVQLQAPKARLGALKHSLAAGHLQALFFQRCCNNLAADVPQSIPFLRTARVEDFACLIAYARSTVGERILLTPRTMPLLLLQKYGEL